MKSAAGRMIVTDWPERLTPRNKLILGLCGILALMVLILVADLVERSRQEADFGRAMTRLVPERALTRQAIILVYAVDDLGAWYAMSRDSAASRGLLVRYNRSVQQFNVITDRLGDLADSQAKAAAIARIRREWQGERGYVRRNEAAFRLKDQGKVDQALREYLAVPYAPILDLLRAYDASTSATIEVERRKMTRAGVIGGAIALICSAGALVLAILLALRSGDVGRRLQRATRALSEVIRDDLTALSSSLSAASRGDPSTGRSRPERQPLAISGSDEAATLAASYNRLIDSVEEISGALSDHLGSLGHRDPLTGLPTRAELKHSLARAIAESKTRGEGVVAVVVLDVDGFKKINDSLGAAIGDELLKQIAGRLATCARESDMLARPGGDEFIVVLDAVRDRAHAAQLALEMIAAAERPYDLSGRELYVSMSAGLGLYPEDGNDIDELLQNADSALSRARAVQRSGFAFYEPAMRSEALEQLVLETDLRRALQSDEFEVYYQSILSTHSERIIGFEALLRWLHPSLGLMRPAAFLSTAEGMSLIVGIGKKVLHTACLQAKAWHQHGLPVRMNVNVSAPEFHRQDLYASVAEILHETGFPPHALELEITESLIMQDLRSARVTLRALRDLGIRIAIDDFGTGYSSLEYLRSLPIDTLKIDHSFVRGIAKSSRDAAFAKAIVAFAQTLDLRVIAEGVETIEQLSALRAIGCDEIQGHLVSEALSAGRCSLLLEAGPSQWEPLLREAAQ